MDYNFNFINKNKNGDIIFSERFSVDADKNQELLELIARLYDPLFPEKERRNTEILLEMERKVEFQTQVNKSNKDELK